MSRPRVVQESSESCPRVVQESSKSRPRVVQESSKSCPRVVQELSKSRPRVVQESSKSSPRVVRTCFLPGLLSESWPRADVFTSHDVREILYYLCLTRQMRSRRHAVVRHRCSQFACVGNFVEVENENI
jgi:hypothetical protein